MVNQSYFHRAAKLLFTGMLFGLSTGWVSGLKAQTTDPMKKDSVLEISGDRQEGIPESEKPNLIPPDNAVKVETEGLEFETRDIQVETSYTPPKPRLIAPKKEVWPSLMNNTVKLGFGRFLTPVGYIFLNNGRNDDYDFGLDFTHISASQGHVDYGEFRDDFGTVKARYFMKNHSLGAKVFVQNNQYFYYADTIVEGRPDLKDTIKYSYWKIAAQVDLARNYTPDKIYYNVKLQFKDFFDRNKNQDLHFTVLPDLNWRISKMFSAGIDANFTFSKSRFDSTDQSRIFFDFSPHAGLHIGNFAAKVGLKMNTLTDSLTYFGAYPFVKAEYRILPNNLSAFVGYQGEMKYNQYYEHISVNKWLNQMPDIRPTKEKVNIFGGLTGSFAKYFAFTARGYYKIVENQLIYFNPEGGSRFAMVYDTLFKEGGAEVGISFNYKDKIKAGLEGKFRSFKTSNIAANYGIPNLEMDFYAGYNFADKVWVTAEVFLKGKRTMTSDALGNPITQNVMADINFMAEYRFLKRFSIFLDLNNLLGNKYTKWYNYQERPFDVRGGVSVSF